MCRSSWRWFAGTILEVASVSEFEKDLGKKKEGTDTLNQNQENFLRTASGMTLKKYLKINTTK